MTPFVADADFTLYVGDALAVLRDLPDASAHCCVTSPPYWGLRDYGTGSWTGGDPGCDHRHETKHQQQGATSQRAGRANADAQRNETFRDVCGKCGATRTDQQLGLEATPELYVAAMVDVFREVGRVLRADGTLWLNLGDSYAGGGGYSPGSPSNVARQEALAGGERQAGAFTVGGEHNYVARQRDQRVPPGLKPKDLVGIPWRVALALQADGWYLRSDVVWSKPNPMPESVTDRPTRAHEYVFLLTQSPRYYFDADAVREPDVAGHGSGNGYARSERLTHQNEDGTPRGSDVPWTPGGGRNIRSVWEITTQGYADAHFATFPEALPERCIKAGSPVGGTILDPFGGAGTTAFVARKLGRRAILIELNEDYARLAADRLKQLSLFAEIA